MDFLAHSAGGNAFRGESLRNDGGELIPALYHSNAQDAFFTSELDEFRQGLKRIECFGDEAPLIGLDCCLDYPWRQATNCHRIVVMMTDEPFETAAWQDEQHAMLATLQQKIQRLRVMLYLVAPESAVYDELSAVEKGIYEVADRANDGMASVDFHQVMLEIGKSVSVCDWQMPQADTVPRGIFSQADWGVGGSMEMRDRS